MRNLTILRTKSFAACLAKMKVYIEDPLYPETTINKVPCRKIGTLKNGEEKTFSITENEAKVFIIADKLSKGFCNEFYTVPAGMQNVYLSGRNRFNPASGNAFRFDGDVGEDVLQNRKKGTKKGIIVLIAAFIIGIIIGLSSTLGLFSSVMTEPKVFSSDGMTITLTNEFIETSFEGYNACYDSEDVAVFALKEEFDLMDGLEDYTLEQYGELVLENNGFPSDIELQNILGLTYFEYEYGDDEINDTYYYFAVLYKASDAFWMIQFATQEENAELYQQSFIDWAKSVEFNAYSHA